MYFVSMWITILIQNQLPLSTCLLMSDIYYDPETAEEEYDKNDFKKYLTLTNIIVSLICLVVSIFVLRSISGVGLSLPDSGTISGDEVFLMVQRLDNYDQLILYNARNQKQKELLFLKTSPTSKTFQAQILNPKVSKDGKILCFCRKISQDIYRIYKMNESGSQYNWILRNSTCNYNFTADEKGIIFSDKFAQISSIKFDKAKAQDSLDVIVKGEELESGKRFFNVKMYENKLYYIDEKAVWMKDLTNDHREMIFKIAEMGYFEFTPDWLYLIITDLDNETVFIYERADLKLIKRFKAGLKVPYTRSINHKTFFSPDGKIIYLLRQIGRPLLKAEGDKQQYYDYKFELIRIEYSKCLEGDLEDEFEVEYETVTFPENINLNKNIAYKTYQ